MTPRLRVLGRLDGGWPSWLFTDAEPDGLMVVVHTWDELSTLQRSLGDGVELSFAEDALEEMVSALGAPESLEL